MVRLAMWAGIATAFITLSAAPVWAQDGCKQVTSSCSALLRNCEQNCGKVSNNASACVCSQPFEGCKANGVWRSVQSGSACWATKNRS